jgi:hypothetical protein
MVGTATPIEATTSDDYDNPQTIYGSPQPTVAPAATAPAVPATSSPTTGSDAADRHAKRTACIKDAKTKKLLGPDKTAYIKNCAATP